jgi:hypothetical protein
MAVWRIVRASSSAAGVCSLPTRTEPRMEYNRAPLHTTVLHAALAIAQQLRGPLEAFADWAISRREVASGHLLGR